MFIRPFHGDLQRDSASRLIRLSIFFVLAAVSLFVLGHDILRAAGVFDTGSHPAWALPGTLRETGLYARRSFPLLRAGIVAFSPQYLLRSDGAEKRRWLFLPPGSFIDASPPDAWVFPRGTRGWKEFAYEERPIENRSIERLGDGSWRASAPHRKPAAAQPNGVWYRYACLTPPARSLPSWSAR